MRSGSEVGGEVFHISRRARFNSVPRISPTLTKPREANMSGPKFLSPEEKKSWKEDGYIKLSGVFSAKEMTEISKAYDELYELKPRENVEGLESASAGNDMKKAAENMDCTGKSIYNLQMHSATFTRLITNPKLLDALEDIMETENIVLHHTEAYIAPPERGAPFPIHQDCLYVPHKKHTVMAVFLHLDDTTPESGCLAVYPGSHKLGPLEDHGATDENGEQYHCVDPERFPLSGAVPIFAKKGDIFMFSDFLLHGTHSNLSTRPCRFILVQVNAADDEPVTDVHKSPCQNLVLRGINVNREVTLAL